MSDWTTSNTIKFLRDKADRYVKKDGTPGDLSDVWGFRDIAKTLRDIAFELELAEKVNKNLGG